MTLPNILTLALVVAMFASFVGVLGAVTLWMALLERREKAALAKAAPKPPPAAHVNVFRKAA